jgi:methionine synthase II (cobalamin-independent)
VRGVRILRENTDRHATITLPGPFLMTQRAEDNHYGDPRALALDLAAAVNEEGRDLFAAGADLVQIDEPYLQARSAGTGAGCPRIASPAPSSGLRTIRRSLNTCGSSPSPYQRA